MAICNKDFRVKHGLYVGTGIDVTRGALSAQSVNVGGGYGSTGVSITTAGNLSANGAGVFDQNLNAACLYIGGGYGSTGLTVTDSGNLSANGVVTAASFAGAGDNLTSNFTISAGGDVDGVSTNVTALNGTYSLNLELTNQPGLTAGSYGSATAIPTFTVDEDGRLTAAGSANISTTLSAAGDSGSGTVALGSQSLTIAGTSNEIETSASNQTITIGLPDNVTIGGDLTVTGNDIIDSGGSAALTFDGSQNVTTGANLTVTGNLLVSGNTITQNVSAVTVEDPVIKVGSNNTNDAVDLGFYGQYGVGACGGGANNRYAGLIRDTSMTTNTAAWVFFADSTTDILSANQSGSSAPAVANYAPVYVGGLGIGTNASVASNKLTISGAISGDNNITIDGTANFKGNVTLGDASGDSVTINAATINPANIAAGTANTVVVYNGSTLVTDEIDSRVWGSSLVDTTNVSGSANHIAFFTGTNTVSSESGAELYWDSTNDRIGIGTASPTAVMDVLRDDTDMMLYLDRTNTMTGLLIKANGYAHNPDFLHGSPLLQYTTFDSGGTNPRTFNISTASNGSVLFGAVSGQNIACTRMTILTGGNIGIGTITPNELLTVAGNISASNTVYADAFESATGGSAIDFEDSITINNVTNFDSLSTAVGATCTSIPVFSKAATAFRSGKFLVQSSIGTTQYEVTEILVIHDGTDVHITEYGDISTGSTFCTQYTADINSGNVRILATNCHNSVDSTVTVAANNFLI